MITHTTVDYCRCCGCENLFMYLDLGTQPLANGYHTGTGKDRPRSFPLEVYVCKKCWHSQLGTVVNPRLMFDNYLYVSGTTSTLKKHFDGLAEDALDLVGAPARVLDIACNDGTLLDSFKSFGADVYGIDPAHNLREITKEKDIPVLVDYWGSQAVAAETKERFGTFDIVVATNVFAHVADVDSFLLSAKDVLNKDGVIILEFPYAFNLFFDNEFDTIYHEHLSYFLVNSFKALVDRLDLVIVKVSRHKIHGGSIRFYLKKDGKEAGRVKTLIHDEKMAGLHQIDTYIAFSKRVLHNKLFFRNAIEKMRRENKIIVGYGASAKGNTMLNYFNISLDFIVDDNPKKWGLYTPGKDIKIYSPDALDIDEPLVIVVLAWNFFSEIQKKIRDIRGDKETKYSMYVPQVVVHD